LCVAHSVEIHEDNLTYSTAPTVRVDPTNRCAVMLAYGRRLIIIPFRPDLAVNDPFESIDDFRPLPASYVLELNELNIHNIKDYIFLEVKNRYCRRRRTNNARGRWFRLDLFFCL
jgi:hypothetical protein